MDIRKSRLYPPASAYQSNKDNNLSLCCCRLTSCEVYLGSYGTRQSIRYASLWPYSFKKMVSSTEVWVELSFVRILNSILLVLLVLRLPWQGVEGRLHVLRWPKYVNTRCKSTSREFCPEYCWIGERVWPPYYFSPLPRPSVPPVGLWAQDSYQKSWPQVTWDRMEWSLKSQYQHLELNLEANQDPVEV